MGHEFHYQAPANATEFWDRDGEFIYNFVRKNLGPAGAQDAEDVAADIIERLLTAKNAQGQTIFGQYDPDKLSERTGHNVTWRGFLSGKVMLYIRGKREQLQRRTGRELLLCDTQQGDSGERWVELFGGQVWDDYPSLTDAQFAERMRDYLAAVPDGWDGEGSLFQVFNEILERIKNGERVTQVAGMSRKNTAAAIARIRQVVIQSGGQLPQPIEVCGVALSPSEARDALDRLRKARGNHVHRALAGHRLMAEGPKGWYHDFSRTELVMFPECGVEAREGKIGGAGAGHVKEAVMHGLARMLAGVPEPALEEPEDEVSREEQLESELWHIKGLDGEKIDAIIAAAQKVYA